MCPSFVPSGSKGGSSDDRETSVFEPHAALAGRLWRPNGYNNLSGKHQKPCYLGLYKSRALAKIAAPVMHHFTRMVRGVRSCP
jgi:hypothetical protein